MRYYIILLSIGFGLATAGCADLPAQVTLDDLVPNPNKQEVLAEGYWWSEGPVWVGGQDGYLLFTDVPQNKMFKWSESEGASEFLSPSGADIGEAEGFREAGANGLFNYSDGKILLADHGNRALMLFDIESREKTVLAGSYNGKTLNSPNDVVLRADGVMFFTDPPYGLTDLDESPLKEQMHNGVYRLAPDGTLTLIDDRLTRPNGVILTPDGKTLIVANSDPKEAKWISYRLNADDEVMMRMEFGDATERVGDDAPGLPDGMAMSTQGYLFATGPGGLYVFDPDQQYMGRIDIARASANVTFGGDGSDLYVTSGDRLIRIRTNVKGLGFK
ncbi:SMP-30/gluconolactonase/LRE family protein [Robiginitomaculum antarcticum]|uniref:SMP-30/gluconolactonase/LRE family protein n=1 Tax=Robiginitomaculum antarcticum TaxID=437507 RepID=UPI0003A8492F|nr:SMP-30/gluconolactonase/LRE family protein [Robiginitomaculum antarcticum]